MKLIKILKDFYIVVDLDQRGKEGFNFNYGIRKIDSLSRDYEEDSHEWRTCFKITHSTKPIFDQVKEIFLSEVEEAIYGYNVEKMAMSYLDRNYNLSYERTTWQKLHEKTFEAGFNAHKELMKDKFFTIDDMKNAIALAWIFGQDSKNNLTDSMDNIIQSLLPKTEWEVEFDENGKLRIV